MNRSSIDEDVQWVADLVDGHDGALAALYDRHAPTLLTLGRHVLRDLAWAEEVLHDVFLEVWRDAGAFDPRRGSVRAWLVVRMRSRCLDALRGAQRRRDLLDAEEPSVRAAAVPTDRRAVAGMLARASDGLSEVHRQTLEALYVRGLTSAEAAEELGWPQGTVKSRARAALRALRRRLGVGRCP